MDAYKVLDDRKINWKILPEKEKIGEWETQKATTELYGRKWIAWFTTAIPLQDGPYKFQGLPGLIVKISDATNSHVFELKAAAKFNQDNEDLSAFYGGDKSIEINQKQYQQLFTSERNDPMKSFKLMISSGMISNVKDGSGNEISMSDLIRKREKSAKERLLKDNNLLELDLLK